MPLGGILIHGLSTTQYGIDPLLSLREQSGITILLAYLWPNLLLAVAAVPGHMITPNCQHAVAEPVVLEHISHNCMQNSLLTAAYN